MRILLIKKQIDMSTEVAILHFNRKKGKLYYINSGGNLVEMDPSSKEKTIVARPGITKVQGYLYFLNRNGNIARAKMKNQ